MNHDLQLHTNWSDGYHTISEQVDFALAAGLDAIAITDHLLPGSRLESRSERAAYLAEIDRARVDSSAEAGGLLVLAGIEATVIDEEGAISVDESVARDFSWVLCDLSHFSGGTLRSTPASKSAYVASVLRAYHRMCEFPFIDVISHPFNTGNTDPPLGPSDYPRSALDELAAHMASTGTVFDIMNLMPFWFRGAGIAPVELTRTYAALVSIFSERGVWFQLSSDDHRSGLGNTRWSERIVREAGVALSQLVAPGRRLPPRPA